MGIGVYESHQYVTSLGGQLTVESAEGLGTRVRIVLPSEKVAIFHENLAKLDRERPASAGGTRAPRP